MHSDNSGSASLSMPADRLMPVHPDVRLKPLPFYDVIAELLKPSTLREFFKTFFNTWVYLALLL